MPVIYETTANISENGHLISSGVRRRRRNAPTAAHSWERVFTIFLR